MRCAALTLTALSLLSACADSVDYGVPAFTPTNTSTATTKNGVPFFTTDPAYFANPQPAYAGTEPMYLATAPYYYGSVLYFAGPRHARYSYCPPRRFSHRR